MENPNLLKNMLIKTMCHDLRGSLGNLKSIVSLIKEDYITLEQIKTFMTQVDENMEHSLQMLDELYEWGNTITDDKKINHEEIVLKEIIDFNVNKMNTTIQTKKLNVSTIGDINTVCLFNKNALKIVLRNLISNAVKFTENNGSISIKIDNDEKDSIAIEIIDTGIGISEKMKTNLFGMKKDNNRIGTAKEKGSGLGLFISYDLITKNNGSLEVKDNPSGKGTVFKLVLPKSVSSSLF